MLSAALDFVERAAGAIAGVGALWLLLIDESDIAGYAKLLVGICAVGYVGAWLTRGLMFLLHSYGIHSAEVGKAIRKQASPPGFRSLMSYRLIVEHSKDEDLRTYLRGESGNRGDSLALTPRQAAKIDVPRTTLVPFTDAANEQPSTAFIITDATDDESKIIVVAKSRGDGRRRRVTKFDSADGSLFKVCIDLAKCVMQHAKGDIEFGGGDLPKPTPLPGGGRDVKPVKLPEPKDA